jgi:tetratricopeptide (TPR) repeat protein
MKYLIVLVFFFVSNAKGQLNTDSLQFYEKFKSENMYYSTPFSDAQKNYESGLKLFNENLFKESIPFYLKAIDIDAQFIDAMDNLGNSYRYLGNLDSAEYWYKRSIKLYPSGYVAHQNLAIVYNDRSFSQKALNEYDIMIKLNPGNPEGYFGKTSIYVSLGNGDEVILNANKALELYKKTNDSYEMDAEYMIGIGYYLKGDIAQAKKHLLVSQKLGKEIPSELEGLLK